MSNGNSTRVVSRLDHASLVRLVDWLRAKREWIEHELPHPREVAKAAEEEIGKPVSVSAIRRTCEAIGLTWTPQRKRPRRSSKLHVDRNWALAILLGNLYRELGVELPSELTKLITKHTLTADDLDNLRGLLRR